MKTHPLIRALGKLVPEATFAITGSRDWYSMTFSGQQLTIGCEPTVPDFHIYYKYLVDMLPEHEFSLPGLVVADIAVVTQQICVDNVQFVIEALVINE